MTSAVRVGGERLYRKAHRGEDVETPPRDVEVYRAELLCRRGRAAHYEIECSAGTYVRTLIETLGDAYCSELRRTAIGPFPVEDAGERIAVERVAELSRRRRGGAVSIEVTPLAEAGRARARWRSAPSTASTSATAR